MNDLGDDIGKVRMSGEDEHLYDKTRRERDQKIERLERYRPAVIAYMLRRGFPHDEAHDHTQRVFLRVCQNVDAYRGQAAWGYLETVAKSVVANTIRDRHTQKRDAVEESLEKAARMPDERDVAADERLHRKERASLLRHAVEQLEPGLRASVVLYLQDLSYEEIAKQLHLSVTAVKSRLNTARHRLRELLGVDLPGTGGE